MKPRQGTYSFVISGTLASVGIFELVNAFITPEPWRSGLAFGVPLVGCAIFQAIGTERIRRNRKKQQP